MSANHDCGEPGCFGGSLAQRGRSANRAPVALALERVGEQAFSVKLEVERGLAAPFGYPESTWTSSSTWEPPRVCSNLVGLGFAHIGAWGRPVDDVEPRAKDTGRVVWLDPWKSNGLSIRANTRSSRTWCQTLER